MVTDKTLNKQLIGIIRKYKLDPEILAKCLIELSLCKKEYGNTGQLGTDFNLNNGDGKAMLRIAYIFNYLNEIN